MRFEAIPINKHEIYNLFIETEDKPDSELREIIREQIREAMRALGREPDSYSVIIGQADREEPEDTPFPYLAPGGDYLLFAIRRSSRGERSAESLSARELEELKRELAVGIIPPENSRIALVLLRDCSIGIIVSGITPVAEMVNYDQRATPSRRSRGAGGNWRR